MGRVTGTHIVNRWVDAELSDPALAHLFGRESAALVVDPPAVAYPAPLIPPAAARAPAWRAWANPSEFLEVDETLFRLEDGGFFQIRDVRDDLDFEISVEEDAAFLAGLETRAVMNLDDFPAEFEADLAVFEGIRARTHGDGPPEYLPGNDLGSWIG